MHPAKSAPLIFIVDDDPGLLRLLRKGLERDGYRTEAAQSGKEAQNWLRKNRADLLLLDLKLPDIEGTDLITLIESIAPKAPFIVITGQGDERVAVEMMKRGALDYVVKDHQFLELVPTIVEHALQKVETEKRLAAAQAELLESKTQLLLVSEREQRLFGAELHDNLGQQLTAIEMRCHAALQEVPKGRAALRDQILEIGKSLREAISQTRLLARGLAPIKINAGGLQDALAELASRMSKRGRVICALEADPAIKVDEDVTAQHLYRLGQEAVTNAIKHSGASQVNIRLAETNNSIRLEISDNGKGLPRNAAKSTGIGLEIMKHRASVIGGELEVTSKPGKGVTVACTVPVKRT